MTQYVNCRFGEVREISAVDYVAEVNKAGEGIFVVLHLYKQGIPLCALINQYLTQLAAKFPTVKVMALNHGQDTGDGIYKTFKVSSLDVISR